VRLTRAVDDHDAQVGPAAEGEIDGEDGHAVTLRPELNTGQGKNTVDWDHVDPIGIVDRNGNPCLTPETPLLYTC
jgi:hypothetical protein